MTVLSGYRLALGTLTKAEMDANVNVSAIENWTRQADMSAGRLWLRPGNEADVIDQVYEIVESLSGHAGGYGAIHFTWKLNALTPLMAKYIRDTFFGSTGFSADVTVRTWNRDGAGTWEYINCIANRRMLKESQPAAGGYHEYPIDFTEGSYAPDGPDLTPSLTRSGSLTQFVEKIYTVTVDNVGDGATFADIVVTVDLPASLDYVSSSAAGWTIEYSINDGGSYSPTPPGDLTGVTNLRYTRTTAIDAGADASFTFTILPTLAIAVQTDVAVTTTGDTASGNNSDSDATAVLEASGFDTGFSAGFGG